ncbi:hypothetical protein QYE76_048231 [Lolium multiflorum]|uniref:Reverse transcriptase Ty1/copia-type domain-containing protein n=1 Tax=Lolium multiflorum TaxID=4521 RepID=A0AAD8V5M8_LOLMU|nr:hypothetical protein QYE76_048231 [Lolium multiflorum]
MSSSTSSATALAAALGSPPSQLLTRDNALIWKALVIPALRGARVLDLVEGKEEAPEKTLEAEDANNKKVTIENPEYSAWISRDQQVLRWILNALSPDVLAHVVGLETSAEAWAAITAHVSSTSKTRVQQLRSALNDTRKNDLSAEKYFAKMKAIASELAAAGKPLDPDDLIWYILKGLGSHYNTLRTAVNANPGTTLDDLLSQVQAYDRMHKADEGFTSSANVARRGGAPPRGPERPRQDDRPRQQQYDERPRYDDRGRGDDRGRQDFRDRRDYRDRRDDQGRRDGGGYQGRRYDDDRPHRRNDEDRRDGGGRGGKRDRQPTPYVNTTCQICDIHGHPARDCWWRYGDDPRGDGDRGNKGANFTGVDTNWYYDTGATDHITSELSKLHAHDKYDGHDRVRTAEGSDVSTGRVYISRDVVFDENVFPFQELHPNAGALLKKEILLLPTSTPDEVAPHTDDHMSTIVPICVPPVFVSQVAAPAAENLVQNDAPQPPESYAEISMQSAHSGANNDADSREHSPARRDPEGDSLGSPRGSASCSASAPCSPVRPTAAAPPAAHTPPPASTPPWPRGAGVQSVAPDADAQSDSDNAVSSGSGVAQHAVPADVASPAVSSAGSSALEADAPAAPSSSPPGPRTRLQKGIRQPKQYTDGTVRYGMLSSTGEPRNLPDALKDTQWRAAMQDEYDALMLNKTWTLVPPSPNKNVIDCKWVYRIKRRADGTIDVTKHGWLRKDSSNEAFVCRNLGIIKDGEVGTEQALEAFALMFKGQVPEVYIQALRMLFKLDDIQSMGSAVCRPVRCPYGTAHPTHARRVLLGPAQQHQLGHLWDYQQPGCHVPWVAENTGLTITPGANLGVKIREGQALAGLQAHLQEKLWRLATSASVTVRVATLALNLLDVVLLPHQCSLDATPGGSRAARASYSWVPEPKPWTDDEEGSSFRPSAGFHLLRHF